MFQLKYLAGLLAVAATAFYGQALAFDSGSTGADGAFNPTVNTELQLPENGVFNFTSVNIPPGVVVTFARNTTNTPVVMLASGSVTIGGIIDVSGGNAPPSGAAGDGNVGDDGIPGLGGPGGFDGGRGGPVSTDTGENTSGAAHGPGAAGPSGVNGSNPCGGAGGGFGSQGEFGGDHSTRCENPGYSHSGQPYGQPELLPLIGGSGGAGGAGYTNYIGGGGGGGAGTILIAASGTITVDGEILARGGRGGANAGQGAGGAGGSGSGGAIKLMASLIEGEGTIVATGGGRNSGPGSYGGGGSGGTGRIRLEADAIDRTSGTNPSYTFGEPGPVFVAGLPTVRIASVDGVDAPADPTGSADIQLPETTVNPVDVVFETTGVPVGNTVTVRVTPAYGDYEEFISNALSGNETLATAEAEVDLPPGPSVLMATVSYEVPEGSQQQALLSQATGGETVRSVSVQTDAAGNSTTVLTTHSGRRVEVEG